MMKKILIFMLSVISVCCLAAAYGCDKNEHEHNWVTNGAEDEYGNPVYVCSVCGETHEHTFSDEYSKDSTAHWYASICEHTEAKKLYGTHDFDENGVCSVCGYTSVSSETYELQFSYYMYDDEGGIISGSDGVYVYVGVTYSVVETANGVLGAGSIENGETVSAGDYVSFKVKKSVYCEYTDNNNYPVVNANNEAITPDSNGVYSFTVSPDMVTDSNVIIIWVSNVQTRSPQITGSGVYNDPYTINNVTDWLYFADCINNKDYYTDLTYNTAYWALGCDLDFEGEYITMAGDGYSSTASAFMGYFDGKGHTVSNFIISNEITGAVNQYSGYVGLFGMATAYSGVSAVICNLTVKDFKIEATAPTDNACVVGGVVGYGIGFNISNCQVINGNITVNGNSEYYSYIGGVVGILQSYLDEENGYAYYSSLQYNAVSETNMDGTGVLYGMGGIVGYVIPFAESAPVYIINNYAADVSVVGGVHSGGIAGIIGRYATVQNTYATGTVTASSSSDSYLVGYEGTILDSRYAYAGGIVGYADNDTYIGTSFFMGEVSARSGAGTSYERTGTIYGGLSAAGYSDYYARETMIKGNLHGNDKTVGVFDLGEGNLKGKLGWTDADWDFSDVLPKINQSESTHSFTITVIINQTTSGGRTYSIKIDSAETLNVYIPMSYRYLLYEYGEDGGIIQYENGEKVNLRTYGYYFDAACTQRVPTCYVPMNNIQLYANYADTSAITDKVYYITGGSSAEIVFFNDGTYQYEEGAIYLTGNYEYNGRVITFKNGIFSRLSGDASDDEKQNKYTFFATVTDEGNLEIFDGDEVYANASYDTLARFFPVDNPLVAVLGSNITVSGKYYEENGNEYIFNKDYTGTYIRNGSSGEISYSFEGKDLVVNIGARKYTAVLDENGKLVSLVRSSETITLYSYDEFEGVWEQAGIVSKVYEFDGKGNWTFTSGLYSDGGTYSVENGKAFFTRSDNTQVTVSVADDGTLELTQSGGTQSVGYVAQNSLAGVWYTYANAVNRYTLTLGGINPKGWGLVEYEGTEGLRYCAAGENLWYVYSGDEIYTYFTYDPANGTITGIFYDTLTDKAKTYTFYQYDAYYGSWVGSVDELSALTFNGFGMYDVAASGSETRAVAGTVTIGKTTVAYTVNRTTGVATFVYNNVEYTLEYNEYTNTVSVTYDGGTALLAECDEFKDVVFTDKNGVAYSFDGRGYLNGGGVVTIKDGSGVTYANYVIANDKVVISSNGVTKTISVGDSGYVITENGTSTGLAVKNSFTGNWAVYGKYSLLVIGEVRYIPSEGGAVEIDGTYLGTNITLYYNGEKMWFDYGGATYYISALTYGLVLSVTENYAEDADYVYLSAPDAFNGMWSDGDGGYLWFDGAVGAYRSQGNVKLDKDGQTITGTYTINTNADGSVSCEVSLGGNTYTYILSSDSSDGDYSNGSYYLILIKK